MSISPAVMNKFYSALHVGPPKRLKNLKQSERKILLKLAKMEFSISKNITESNIKNITKQLLYIRNKYNRNVVFKKVDSLFKGFLNEVGVRISSNELKNKIRSTTNYIEFFSNIKLKNVYDIKDARLIIMGENHVMSKHQKLECSIIKKFGEIDTENKKRFPILMVEGVGYGNEINDKKKKKLILGKYFNSIQMNRIHLYGCENKKLFVIEEKLLIQHISISKKFKEKLSELRNSNSVLSKYIIKTELTQLGELKKTLHKKLEEIKKQRDLSMAASIDNCLKKFPDRKIFVILGRAHVFEQKGHETFDILDSFLDVKTARIIFKETKESAELCKLFRKKGLQY